MPVSLRALVCAAVLTLGLIRPGAFLHAEPVDPGGPVPVNDSTAAFDAGMTSFTVLFGEEVIPYRVMGVFVMPGTTVPLAVESETAAPTMRIEAEAGRVASTSPRTWRYTAPSEPGLYPMTVRDERTGASMRLNVFVLTPWDHEGTKLDGYRIGRYREQALRGLETYERPDGFVEVTEETKNARVSPHFQLDQFLCKQTEAVPQYALVRTRLLVKLERILAEVNRRGHRVPTLHVMSGFRTPYYNRAIGNTTDYSRHLYGGAADVFVDADGNGRMDDLDGDGRVTEADADVLARVVRDLERSPSADSLVGGLGTYGPAPHRGPFVHVDTRGYRARW